MSGISISELLRRRSEEAERQNQRDVEGQSLRVRRVQQQNNDDVGSGTGEDIATLREALYKKIRNTKQEMSKQATIERQKAWMEEVGTSINFYEQREFSTDELEEYYNIVLTKPELLKVDDAPHNLRLTLQFTKWVKEVHAKKILNTLTGVHGYEDEVNKVLGDVDNDIKENDKVKMPFNDRMDFE